MTAQSKTAHAPSLAELRQRRNEILALARRHGASSIRIFGSVARGDAGLASDIDLIVDLDPDRSLLDLAGLHLDLEDLLGRPVDVGTAASLRERIRERVLRESIPL
ncbi:MAG: nucleotidyltransferase family protein [Acidimicrobiia bacterium]